MSSTEECRLNQAAFRQLKSLIDKSYPPGRFLAISGGNIVADAARFDELDSMLGQLGHHSANLLVVQAGVDYPETVTIFA